MSKNRYSNPISCIYKIFFDNYIYIGSTYNFSKRKFEHLWNLKKNKHPNPIFQNYFNKHGESKINFEIIEKVDIKFLFEKEQFYIDFYKKDDNLKVINILPVAGSSKGRKQSKETIEKKVECVWLIYHPF
jgi:group I intron endonuclease